MLRNVLVTGAGGFLGRQIVQDLISAGLRVRAVVRNRAPSFPVSDDIDIFYADLRDSKALAGIGSGIDAVIHLAAALEGDQSEHHHNTVVATQNLMTALEGTTLQKFVHISSLAVYDCTAINGVLSEDSPLIDPSYSFSDYAIAKLRQETVVRQACKDRETPLTILRPGFVWGPGHMDIAGVGRRIGPLQFCIGPRAPLPITYVVNCSNAIITALISPESGVFNIVDTGEVTRWRFCKRLAHHMRRVSIPVPYMAARSIVFAVQPAVSLLKRQLSILNPRQFECQFRPLSFTSAFPSRFDWVPPLDFDQAWRRSV